jgi:hypothetical protein
MHMHSLNWLAILVAAISTMVVGFLWYSPLLFAKAWMREMGYGSGYRLTQMFSSDSWLIVFQP